MLKSVPTQELKLCLHAQVACIALTVFMVLVFDRPEYFDAAVLSSWVFVIIVAGSSVSLLGHWWLCRRAGRVQFERAFIAYATLASTLLFYLLFFC